MKTTVYFSCRAQVTGEVRRGPMDMGTGKTTTETTTIEIYRCSVPLFGIRRRVDGYCRGCRAKLDAGGVEPLPAG